MAATSLPNRTKYKSVREQGLFVLRPEQVMIREKAALSISSGVTQQRKLQMPVLQGANMSWLRPLPSAERHMLVDGRRSVDGATMSKMIWLEETLLILDSKGRCR